MARPVTERLRLSATFEALTALHVGGVPGDPEVDLTVALDGRERPYIPGTSLAGILRSACVRAAGTDAKQRDAIERIWGGTPENRSEDTAASLVVVDDAVVCSSAPLELRDGIGIDRFTGTAAAHVKYVRQVIPRGSTFEVHVTVDRPAELPDGTTATDIDTVIGLLTGLLVGHGTITVGAAGTRGLGRVCATRESFHAQRLSFRDRSRTIEAVRGGADVTDELRVRATTAGGDEITITVHWAPDGPLMVKAGFDGLAVDTLPLTGITGHDPTTKEAQLGFLLPGSSIKGALRSRAELIVRTLRGVDVSAPGQGGAPSTRRFLDQLADPALELVRWLFGSAPVEPSGPRSNSHTSDEPQPGRGALSVDDCFSKERFPADAWNAVIGAAKQKSGGDELDRLRTALSALGLSGLQPAFHVAVDRWTGGAAEGLLFSVLEPHALEWEPVRIRLDLARLPDAVREAAICLLLVVLRDLAEGWVPFGFGTNRGLGAIQVRTVSIEVPAGFASLPSGQLSEVLAAASENLADGWKAAVAPFDPTVEAAQDG
ncbi:RAMP superfamily CRISPR-associated protein [Rhabdothermincola sediminis]|uniref:RAMP superfamily CRISPR-associated protein n=1 Tax=Rhabdothermincola sediminis TaxID=2751370 RepID=UPI001AA09A64|nr:RAMP superfamily CRISPR-associated protein [Rhabdothermincola sediminis]